MQSSIGEGNVMMCRLRLAKWNVSVFCQLGWVQAAEQNICVTLVFFLYSLVFRWIFIHGSEMKVLLVIRPV